MNRRAVGAAVACLASALLPGPARAQEVAGTWSVTWAQAVRTHADGSFEIQRWGDARLVLAGDGDSLSGTWHTGVGGGVTWRVSGTIQGGRFHLRATEHDSDDPELAIVERMEWEGTVDGDRLEGTVWIVIPRRDREPVRRPWRAEREGGGGVPDG